MSRTSQPIIGFTTLALCASLTLHVTLFAAMVGYYSKTAGRIHLPGFDRTAQGQTDADAIYFPRPVMPDDERLGRQDGTGSAIDESPGELEMQSRKGEQDQPFLSLDPEGPGKVHDAPSQSVAPMGGAGSAGGVASAQPAAASKSLPFGVASIEEHAMPPREIKKPEDGSADASSPEVRAPNFPGEGPKPQEEQRAAAAVPEVTQPTQSPSSAANSAQAAGAASVAGASIPPADPAPQADTQSDPFSSVASVEFRRGKLAAQLGRRHRLTYPRFGIASIVEGALLNESRIALVITIDPSGHVKAARIAKSSGSANIDQAWRLTAYEWWFEPRKDPTGKPTTHDESFLFVITFS